MGVTGFRNMKLEVTLRYLVVILHQETFYWLTVAWFRLKLKLILWQWAISHFEREKRETIVLGILFKNGDFYKLKITWYKVKK